MNIEEYLEAHDMSIEQFAVKFQVSSSSVWHWLSGRRTPSHKIAEWLEQESEGEITYKDVRGMRHE